MALVFVGVIWSYLIGWEKSCDFTANDSLQTVSEVKKAKSFLMEEVEDIWTRYRRSQLELRHLYQDVSINIFKFNQWVQEGNSEDKRERAAEFGGCPAGPVYADTPAG